MILSFGNFLSVTNSAREIRDSKSFTTTAFIQLEQTASDARSYFLSQESISYTKPSIPKSCVLWEKLVLLI